MSKSSAILSIPSPCTENWNEMSPSGHGRYCGKCAKQVIDFSAMTDQQILNFLLQKQGRTCGRLATHQMHRVLAGSHPSRSHAFLKFLLSGLFLTQVEMSIGQSHVVYRYEKYFNTEEDALPAGPNEVDRPMPNDTAKNYVIGFARDSSTMEALIYANVYIQELGIGTVTDLDGNFKIMLPDTFQKDSFTVIVSYTGYPSLQMKVQTRSLHEVLPIYFNLSPGFALGGVEVGSIYAYRPRHWWQFWKKRHY